jgi:hypothetical protein
MVAESHVVKLESMVPAIEMCEFAESQKIEGKEEHQSGGCLVEPESLTCNSVHNSLSV